jgi:hypothetical protein
VGYMGLKDAEFNVDYKNINLSLSDKMYLQKVIMSNADFREV